LTHRAENGFEIVGVIGSAVGVPRAAKSQLNLQILQIV